MLEMLAGLEGRGLTLTEVSRRLGVHKATCHSMLTELLRSGWLARDSSDLTYHLGPALIRMGVAAAGRFPVLDQARPVMSELSSGTRAHCIAFSIEADHVTVVDQVRHPTATGHPMPVGTELPVRPPYGAALASWLPATEQAAWLLEVPEPARARYRRALELCRRRGYAVGLQVLADVRLQQLAALIRATETRGGRLGDLAGAVTEELMTSEDWFPARLAGRRLYHVSHIDSPVLDAQRRPVLMISLVPARPGMTGAEVDAMGRRLAERTAGIVP